MDIKKLKNSTWVLDAILVGKGPGENHRVVITCSSTAVIGLLFKTLKEEIEISEVHGSHTLFSFRNCDFRYFTNINGEKVAVDEVVFLFE